MSLTHSRTRWVLFLATSSITPDDRHVYDLVFGLMSLERAGVLQEDISIYVDGANRNSISALFSIASSHHYLINTTTDFFTELVHNSHENLMLFITGHGSEKGIDAATPITPYKLLNAIKDAPGLKKAVVYFGQCFAGVFNYVNARRQKVKATSGPEVVFIGATNLHESLSASTREWFPCGEVAWVANVFLLHVFRWISSPTDIDGDGRNTIIDSYKHAGVMSNRHHKNLKANGFGQMLDLHEHYKRALKTANNVAESLQQSAQKKLNLQAIRRQYSGLLSVNYVHQECWILNACPAQEIEI